MFLIVGLGNYGKQYEHTRHNVGFDVVSLVGQKLGVPITKRRCEALIGEGKLGAEKLVLALPQTYMNNSGIAVDQLLRRFKLTPANLVVVYDDIDLPLGAVRIRQNGSAGTHNGMRSVLDYVQTQDFPRIRVGVGAREEGYELVEWVLSHYHGDEERRVMAEAFEQAAQAVIELVEHGANAAMNKYNTRKKQEDA